MESRLVELYKMEKADRASFLDDLPICIWLGRFYEKQGEN